MAKKKKTESERSLPELVQAYQKARTAGSRGYQRADRIMKQITAAMAVGEEIALNDAGRKAVLHDKFAENAEKGVIWTPCAARRFELEIIEP